jgi:hypothetical protein
VTGQALEADRLSDAWLYPFAAERENLQRPRPGAGPGVSNWSVGRFHVKRSPRDIRRGYAQGVVSIRCDRVPGATGHRFQSEKSSTALISELISTRLSTYPQEWWMNALPRCCIDTPTGAELRNRRCATVDLMPGQVRWRWARRRGSQAFALSPGGRDAMAPEVSIFASLASTHLSTGLWARVESRVHEGDMGAHGAIGGLGRTCLDQRPRPLAPSRSRAKSCRRAAAIGDKDRRRGAEPSPHEGAGLFIARNETAPLMDHCSATYVREQGWPQEDTTLTALATTRRSTRRPGLVGGAVCLLATMPVLVEDGTGARFPLVLPAVGLSEGAQLLSRRPRWRFVRSRSMDGLRPRVPVVGVLR